MKNKGKAISAPAPAAKTKSKKRRRVDESSGSGGLADVAGSVAAPTAEVVAPEQPVAATGEAVEAAPTTKQPAKKSKRKVSKIKPTAYEEYELYYVPNPNAEKQAAEGKVVKKELRKAMEKMDLDHLCDKVTEIKGGLEKDAANCQWLQQFVPSRS